jgi:hypothetical protein
MHHLFVGLRQLLPVCCTFLCSGGIRYFIGHIPLCVAYVHVAGRVPFGILPVTLRQFS